MNKLARTGLTADPCGVPRSRCTRLPSGIRTGAASHRLTYKITHGRSACFSTALTIRSQRTLSKNFWTSRSMTQSCFQQRSRHTPTASRADRPGRYPYESPWSTGSTTASIRAATTVCATLSATQGTPSTRVPPPAFGISTAITGGGKYDPDDIRFQTLYRLSYRSFSKSARDTASTPGAPLLARTFSQALCTSAFSMANDFPDGLCPPMPFLPGTLVDETNEPRTRRPLRSAPTAPGRNLTATTSRSDRPPRQRYSASRALTTLEALPLAPATRQAQCPGKLSAVPHQSRRPGSRHLYAGHHLASNPGNRQAHPGTRSAPRFRCHLISNDASTVNPAHTGAFSATPSRSPPDTLTGAPFPHALTTTVSS